MHRDESRHEVSSEIFEFFSHVLFVIFRPAFHLLEHWFTLISNSLSQSNPAAAATIDYNRLIPNELDNEIVNFNKSNSTGNPAATVSGNI